jgi:heme exporter protein C
MTENPLLRALYKWLALIVLTYVVVAGLTFTLPDIGGNIRQSSRNLFFHVPMWFTMYLMMALSLYWAVRCLRSGNAGEDYDLKSSEAARMGIIFGVLGLLTGSVWSRMTWSELLADGDPAAWWPWFDPKPTAAAVAVLVYLAYFVLRGSVDERSQRMRLAAVYNIFAAASLVPLTLIVPRMLGGLHPGGDEGSPAFNTKDISNHYRLIFYPAVIGFMLLALWILELRVRLARISRSVAQNT